MQKHVIEYDTSLDALVAITKRLSSYESRFKMSSEDFLINTAKEK